MDKKLLSVVLAAAGLASCFLASTPEPRGGTYSANGFSVGSVAQAQVSGKVISVKQFGAKGNGVSDDTTAIQAAINTASAGTTISFPSGIYTVSNFVVKNRSGLSFVGAGVSSVIKQKPGAPRIATFSDSRDIVIKNLRFDANGVRSFGGVMFYAMTRVRIEDNSYIDSDPQPIGHPDRFAFVFGKGGNVSRDIQILDNVIEDLQLEVDHARNVVIDGNTVSRAVRSAGIGIFTVGDNAVAEDYQITRNTVIDSIGTGITVVIDPPASRNCIFRRITITGNRVIRSNTSEYGIRIGTPDNSTTATGNVFEDITIKDNYFEIQDTAPAPRQIIFANSSATAGILFKRLIVSGNEVQNDGPANKVYAIDLRRIQSSVVEDNLVKGVVNGISLTADLLDNDVRDNAVDASNIAYQVGDSLGENKGYANRLLSLPRTKLRTYWLKSSDSIEAIK